MASKETMKEAVLEIGNNPDTGPFAVLFGLLFVMIFG